MCKHELISGKLTDWTGGRVVAAAWGAGAAAAKVAQVPRTMAAIEILILTEVWGMTTERWGREGGR